MEASLQSTVTALLMQWSAGNEAARESLLPLVYGELRKLAQAMLRQERRDHTLQPTALVNELYLRLVDQRRVTVQDRRHFFGLAAYLMRRVLVDHARRKKAAKRGAEALSPLVDEPGTTAWTPDIDIEALNEALDRLEKVDPRKCRVVELRFIAGFTTEEAAHILETSPATVERDWKFARSWLGRLMNGAR
ncbi:MAG: sigma-70 family RNA polymerase sigma factor [Bryobacteraceae bacterium]|nr:sigma-70 family RNA polymerase sigma factor [Bryobacteraceae bacterium]